MRPAWGPVLGGTCAVALAVGQGNQSHCCCRLPPSLGLPRALSHAVHAPPRPCAAFPQSLIAKIKANTPGADNIIISTHCQNDLGLSTANSLAGAMGGARQVGRAAAAAAGALLSRGSGRLTSAHQLASAGCAPTACARSCNPRRPAPLLCRLSAPSTALASARATPPLRRWSWPLPCAGEPGPSLRRLPAHSRHSRARRRAASRHRLPPGSPPPCCHLRAQGAP